jgi:TP901 family phage tail tape measure protein
MEELGIKALDARGNLRDMGDVVEEIGGKWDNFSRNQQVALAQVIAGTRQYSRMMALFDNWDMYESAKNTSENSLGALEEQNSRYLDSMEAHLNQLTAATEGLYDTLLDPDSLNPLIDALTRIVELADQMIQGLGGGGDMLLTLGSIGFNMFGN